MRSGIVADIQRASVHDGPGIRTTVFFKGCPLSCAWCHNPECISFEVQELFYPQKCIGCKRCDEGCFSGARTVCGRSMTAQQVIEAVLEDKSYYGNDGGLTLSGGEPLAQAEFAKEILLLAKKEGIHTAIETSMYLFDETVLSLVDLIMADIKIFDNALHKRYTGVENIRILENIVKADSLNKPIIIRTPIIPEVNGTVENVRAISDFLKNLKNVVKYELLPYHPLGEAKAQALGVERQRFTIPDKNLMEALNRYADLSGQT